MISSSTGDECVLFFGLRGHVVESCDFGTSWAELDIETESSISDGARFGALTVLAANSGTLLTRKDDGPFRVLKHSSGVDFAAVLPLGGSLFLLVGEEGGHLFPETGGDDNDR